MFARRILCPIDFSEPSDKALLLASKLARENGSKLFIVHVEEPGILNASVFGGLPPIGWSEKNKLALTIPKATNVKFEHSFLVGDPVTELIQFAKKKDIDLIVMGTHGSTGLMRILLGSVAEGVLRLADVPVLTLKTDSKDLSATIPPDVKEADIAL